jgi:putative nucleotidyltransferase with HDIG domain
MAKRSTPDGGPLELATGVLADRLSWLVGGAVRDRLRGGELPVDLDIVVEGDVESAARLLARRVPAHAFPLSTAFGAWRVVARDASWHIDVNPLRGGAIESDLALRDFTVNAIAQSLAGGELIDPLGGVADLAARRLRLARADALEADPLRALRLVRLACELDLSPDAGAAAAARRAAPRLGDVAAERIYGELLRIVMSDRAVAGIRMLGELSLSASVLPELDALRDVSQSAFHHLDVFEHTLAVLGEVVALDADAWAVLGAEHRESIAALLDEPLADEVTRGVGLRFGALLHDIAKPQARTVAAGGQVRFPAHDELGAREAHALLGRLRAAERMRAHVAALTLHHLRLGFLVDAAPLSRADLYAYLSACGAVAADVTLLSIADRFATRGERSEEMVAAHLALARSVTGEALRWHRQGPPAAPLRGDELVAELGIAPGPLVGQLLADLSRARFTGEVVTRADAIAYARSRRA